MGERKINTIFKFKTHKAHETESGFQQRLTVQVTTIQAGPHQQDYAVNKES